MVSVCKYIFCKCVLIVMVVILVGFVVVVFELILVVWWICGSVIGVMVFYLVYLCW